MAAMEKRTMENRVSIHFASIDVPWRPLCYRFFGGGSTMRLVAWALSGMSLVAIPGCTTFPDAQATRGLAEKMVAEGYPGMPETLKRRAVQDKAQAICSRPGHEKLS